MDRKLKFVAYWMYTWMLICLVGLFWSTGVFEVAIGLLIAGLYYQAATGLLKRNNRDRIISIVLLAISLLGHLSILLSALSNPAQTQVEFMVALSFALVAISAACLYLLLSSKVVALFKGAGNA